MFGQTFDGHDLAIVGLLVILEGVLSIDNALVLGLLAKRLPKHQQAKALTYGLVGAFVFRLIAVATATYLLHWHFVKLLGGGYLVFVALKHFLFESKKEEEDEVVGDEKGEPHLVHMSDHKPLSEQEEAFALQERVPVPVEATTGGGSRGGTAKFWPTVVVIELTDIAFAVDSILAAIALVGSPPPGTPEGSAHPKLWVVLTGGMLGVMLMRAAAAVFIKLLERFPRFEQAAYLLVVVIGGKLLVDWGANTPGHHRVDFHSLSSPAFWIFWGTMLACFLVGFLPDRKKNGVAGAEVV